MEIEQLLSGDHAAVAAEIETAFKTSGYLVLHGGELASIEAALNGWTKFISLPLDVRERYRANTGDNVAYGGWMLMREDAVYTSHMNSEEIETEEPKQEFGSTVNVADVRWPSETDAPGFAHDVEIMAALLDQIARRLMSVFEHILGEEPGFLRYDPGYFALKHHPGKPGRASGNAEGLQEHSDATVFTMLSQDRQSLQIRDSDDAWISMPADPAGTLLVIPGDWMELFTNGEIPAVRHRVLETEQSRVSMAFFQNVDRMPVGPLARFIDADNPARYPEVMSDIDYIGGESGVPRWQSHAAASG